MTENEIQSPVVITSRLLPGLHFGSGDKLAEISVEPTGLTDCDGKPRWRYYLDLPGGISEKGDDLYGWSDAQGMLGTLAAFLAACAESRSFSRSTGYESENADLFSDAVGEWAEEHSDDLSMAAFMIEELESDVTE